MGKKANVNIFLKTKAYQFLEQRHTHLFSDEVVGVRLTAIFIAISLLPLDSKKLHMSVSFC